MLTGLPFRTAPNKFAALGGHEALVNLHGTLKTLAASLMKIANDVRWLASGPRCGLGEISLPATQPGSSIMPGKVNPVMCEMVIQAGAQVIGNDTVVTFSGTYGAFELNTMMPVAAYNLLQSISLLANGARTFARRCVTGLEADKEKCEVNIERSLAMCTALAPVIGYDKAARIAKVAFETNRNVREVAAELSGLSPERLADLLDPRKQV
jgi:fumarate hydratase class II